MALGTPIVASNTGGVKKLMNKFSDYLANPEDEKGYYKKLLSLLQKSESSIKQLSRKLKTEAQHYDAIKTAQQMMEVYHHVSS